MMMTPSLTLFSPPQVTIQRRRYILDDDDADDHDDNDNETSAPATTDTVVSCEYHDDLNNEYYCSHPTKRQRRRCITLLPSSSFTSRSRLFVPMLEDPDQGETSTTTCTQQEEGGFPPPSLPFAVSYRQEVEEEDERREGAGRSVSPWNYLFDETPPFLQPKKKKISLQQDIEQEEQQYDIEQGQEQQQGSRGCSMHPVVYHNNSKSNSNPSPLPASRKINKSTRSSSSCSNNYLQSYPRYGSPKGTHQQRQRQTSRCVVLPSPSPFLPSSFPVVEDAPGTTTTTTTTTDVVLIEDTIVEQFQRATRLTEEQEELPLSTTTTTTLQTSPSFDIMLRY